MQKFIVLIILCIGFQPVQAQLFTHEHVKNLENFDQKRWSWGYFLGLNTYDFDIDYKNAGKKDIIVNKRIGFNVGLLGNLRVNDYIDIRLEPGVTFASRQLVFPVGPNATEEFKNDHIRDVKSTYVHIPLLIKFSTKRINNFKPFVMAGVSASWNLSSNEDNPEGNLGGNFRMKTMTYYYEIGFGIDFYLFFFKFTPSIRAVFAMSDELVPDNVPDSPYTSNISSLKTQGIFINLKFQ